MKLLSCLILFTIFGVLHASTNCDCQNNCRRKIKVKDDYNPEIKVIYTGTPCACQKALPFRVEKPIKPKYKLHKHKYNVEIKEEKSTPDCRYIYNTKVEKPVVEKEKLSKYPVRVEKLLEECANNPRFIYSVKIEKPEKKCETQLDGLVAKVDKIVVPMEDCPQPCCETPKNKIKKQRVESSEESSEEICIKKKYKVLPKVHGCPKCEAIVSGEEGCGCSSKHSSEEDNSGPCDVEVQTSEESCEFSLPEKEYCSQEAQTSRTKCEESSEEILQESSEESHEYYKPSRTQKICEDSSEETPKTSNVYCQCGRSKYESSEEEIQTESSSEEVECRKPLKKCEESSEEEVECQKPRKKYAESSEEEVECQKPHKKCVESSEEEVECQKPCKKYAESSEEEVECQKPLKKCVESSEEEVECQKPCKKYAESSEEEVECQKPRKKCVESSEEEVECRKPCKKYAESSEEEESEESYEEEHWCRGKPTKIYHKPERYSNSCNCCKRFSRFKRELFLDDMHDFSVYTEPLTRNEIQKTVAKLIANSTLASANKKKRKGKRRQRNKHLVQNEDQFEENNKFKHVLENSPKHLEDKLLEEEMMMRKNEERDKRHSSQCRTIEYLKRKPKYDMNVLADAGCSQYIPEIISSEEESSCECEETKNKFYDYILANRNKRHLSTFDGNHNYPIHFVDATKRSSPQHLQLKKIQYRRHQPKPPSHKDFAVDPKFYYKYLSLTAPDLSPQLNQQTPEDRKIVFDHLGHKFLEFNGFRTLIKPKIEYQEDGSEEKPKFWTCKEDLIDPKDFGKTTTIFEDLGSSTEPNIVTTTDGINSATELPKNEQKTTTQKIEDLQEHEFNLCEYLKNLELTQNVEAQQEAKNVFLQNCEDYIKFLIFNPSNNTINGTETKYLENLLHNSHLKNHFKKLFHIKHKFQNNLANITKLLHKPKVVENFKNYLLFKNEFDSMKSKLNLNEYTIFNFYTDAEIVSKFEKNTTSTTSSSTTDN